jgi:hypothetical protein
MLTHGFYAFDIGTNSWKSAVEDLHREGHLPEKPKTLSIVGLLRALQGNQSLSRCIVVPKLDWAIYHAFWLQGGEAAQAQEGAKQEAGRIARTIGRLLNQNRDRLSRQAPIVLLPFSSLQQRGTEWWAGVKHPQTKRVQELFRVEQLLRPPVEPRLVGEFWGCYASF